MRYSSLIIPVMFLCLTSTAAYAENWVSANTVGKTILLDKDSVKVNNESLYYNVRYYEDKAGEDVVVTIQSKNNYAGVVSTCKLSQYNKNKSLANTSTSKVAKKMNFITPSSMLYEANEMANTFTDSDKTNSSAGAGKEPNFGPYMRELQRSIKMNWDPPKGNESRRVVLLFKIAKDGGLLSCSVYQSSGIYNVDAAAVEAVKTAAPFKPLPSEYTGSTIDIQFTFDYNVFGANKK